MISDRSHDYGHDVVPDDGNRMLHKAKVLKTVIGLEYFFKSFGQRVNPSSYRQMRALY